MAAARKLLKLSVLVVFTGMAGPGHISDVYCAPVVWSGLTFTFTKPAVAQPPFAADQITANVALTRGISRGLYNAELDKGFNDDTPSGTRWATEINNPGQSIAATNWESLTFSTWLTAYGGSGQVGLEIEGRNAVVHLVEDDIYLDLRFTNWQTMGEGAAFTYMRAVAPATPPPTGDFNGNGTVDAADYTAWRDTLGQAVAFPGLGADGDQDGIVDIGDYSFWKQHFGETAGGTATSFTANTVPEPATTISLVVALAASVSRWWSWRLMLT